MLPSSLLHILVLFSIWAGIGSYQPGNTVALFNDGTIGKTGDDISNVFRLTSPSGGGRIPSVGGCRWFGLAPFCIESCPAGYDFIREHSGRCEGGTSCPPDASFGESCLRLFGYQLTKKFCCKSDPIDCTWSGRWMGAEDAFNFYCRYDSSAGRCGRLDCSVNAPAFQAHNTSFIGGADCDELRMWNLHGKASCGYIAWFEQGQLRNSWYKSH